MNRGKVLEYFKGDELPTDAWISKYALKDKEGNVLEETPMYMHDRMAIEFARIEKEYIFSYLKNKRDLNNLSTYGKSRTNEFIHVGGDYIENYYYNLFKDFKYIIPGGSVMSMLGNNYSIGSLSNCFVIGQPKDSSNGIMLKRTDQFNLMKRRGGVGKDLSLLRPKGSIVNNAAKTSTGASSFMDVDSHITNEVAQDGRRGALMLTMDIRHPDILDFITKKQDLTKVTGANISVKITDDFIQAVKKDEDYILRYPVDTEVTYSSYPYNELVDLGFNHYCKRVKARELWDTLVKCAYNTAEPGIMFEDKHHDYSPDGVYPQFKGITTNPCGEIFMQSYDSCRLLHHNLSSYVKNPFTKEAEFDYKLFYNNAYEALVLGDNLVDLELEAISKIIHHIQESEDEDSFVELNLWKKIAHQTRTGRRCGVGFTALADTIAMLGYKFSSDESLDIIDKIMSIKLQAELDATTDLSILRGTFEGWESNKEFTYNLEDGQFLGNNNFYQLLVSKYPKEAERMCLYGRRNISWSTVAPTGTVSLMTGTSSGIEPVFMPYYMRRKKCMSNEDRVDFTDELGINYSEYPVIHPLFKQWIENNTDGSCYNANKLSKDLLNVYFESSPWYGSTSNDIDWYKRLEIQAIVQRYTTHSISSTLNLPKDTPIELIYKIYMTAWEMNLKGVTIYRDGCRSGILVNNNENNNTFKTVSAIKRPKVLKAKSYITKVKGRNYAIIIGLLENRPYEVFVFDSFDGFEQSSDATITKMKKGIYRYESKEDGNVIENLNDNGNTYLEKSCALYTSMLLRHGADIKYVIKTAKKIDDGITSFVSAMNRILSKYLPKEELVCSECGGRLIKENGCEKCLDCGSSKCNIIYSYN